jgi:hypothetical protein
MVNQKIITLIAIMIIGYAIPIMPSSIDIGEMILNDISNSGSCTSDFCIETQKTLLNYYNLGGLIIGSLSLVVLIQTLRNPN